MKGLDQAARATLRKYGVRFGAYHIYLPLLLKPAPRALGDAALGAQAEPKRDRASTDLLHLAASGRTSIPVEPGDAENALSHGRISGDYGERAVCVDILERLADLIRPALMWREGTTPKPAGAFDGRSFTMTGAMTSLTGASGEDFASILRSLGYRMDRKPKPPEAANETKPPEAATAASSALTEAAIAEAAAPDAAASSEPEAQEPPEAPQAAYPVEAEPGRDAFGSQARAPCCRKPISSRPGSHRSCHPPRGLPSSRRSLTNRRPWCAEATAPVVAETAPAEAVASTSTEPEMIEVWRPAGRSDQRKPQHRQRRPQRDARPAPAAEGATPEQAAQPVAETPAEQKDEGEPTMGPAPRFRREARGRAGPS